MVFWNFWKNCVISVCCILMNAKLGLSLTVHTPIPYVHFTNDNISKNVEMFHHLTASSCGSLGGKAFNI